MTIPFHDKHGKEINYEKIKIPQWNRHNKIQLQDN